MLWRCGQPELSRKPQKHRFDLGGGIAGRVRFLGRLGGDAASDVGRAVMKHDRRYVAFVAEFLDFGRKSLARVGFNPVGVDSHTIQQNTRALIGNPAEVEGSPQSAKIEATPHEWDQNKIGGAGGDVSGVIGLAWCVDKNQIRAIRPQVA